MCDSVTLTAFANYSLNQVNKHIMRPDWVAPFLRGIVVVSLLLILCANTVVIGGIRRLQMNHLPGHLLSSIASADILFSVLMCITTYITLSTEEWCPYTFYCSISAPLSTLAEISIIVKTLTIILHRIWVFRHFETHGLVPVIVSPKTFVFIIWGGIGVAVMIPTLLESSYNRTTGVASCNIGNETLAIVYAVTLGILPSLATVISAVYCINIIRRGIRYHGVNEASESGKTQVLLTLQNVEDDRGKVIKRKVVKEIFQSEVRMTKRVIIIALSTSLFHCIVQALRIAVLFVPGDTVINVSVAVIILSCFLPILRPVVLIHLSPALKHFLRSHFMKHEFLIQPLSPVVRVRRKLSVEVMNENTAGLKHLQTTNEAVNIRVDYDCKSPVNDLDIAHGVSYAVLYTENPSSSHHVPETNVDDTPGEAKQCLGAVVKSEGARLPQITFGKWVKENEELATSSIENDLASQ